METLRTEICENTESVETVAKDNEEDDLELEHGSEEPELEASREEIPKLKLTKLPIGRIRTIIKADPDIHYVNQNAIFLITKATELFIESLMKESYKYTFQSKKKTIQKHDIQNTIDNVDALMFLDGIK